ncbi:MAG: sulfite exporter TauE/SafE family protein [Flavobacteriales bacterium]|jgi:uncharacterized membrane protein YfcA
MDWQLATLFFLVALVYSSAGFGGGSLYIVLLSQTSLPPGALRTLALVCNGGVTLLSSLQYSVAGYYRDWKLWALLTCSLPLAWLGGSIPLSQRELSLLLGACLILAAIVVVLSGLVRKGAARAIWPFWIVYPAAACFGLLAGITGIGGGIYLSPILYFVHWGDERNIAATTSLYIALNSAAGLAGLHASGSWAWTEQGWIPAVGALAGGLIGSRLSVQLLPRTWIRWITSGILIFAGIQLLIRHA